LSLSSSSSTSTHTNRYHTTEAVSALLLDRGCTLHYTDPASPSPTELAQTRISCLTHVLPQSTNGLDYNPTFPSPNHLPFSILTDHHFPRQFPPAASFTTSINKTKRRVQNIHIHPNVDQETSISGRKKSDRCGRL